MSANFQLNFSRSEFETVVQCFLESVRRNLPADGKSHDLESVCSAWKAYAPTYVDDFVGSFGEDQRPSLQRHVELNDRKVALAERLLQDAKEAAL